MKRYPVISTLNHLQIQLQRRSEWLPLALGAALGLGFGAVVLAGVGGLLGVGLCVLALGLVCWRVKDAEPVWIREEEEMVAPKPSVELAWVEPLEMVELDGGTFLMGSAESDDEAYGDERPQHEVTVSAFAISPYLITRQLYQEWMADTPEEWEEDGADARLPANYITWFDAVAFCNALSEAAGLMPCYHIDGEQVTWDAAADGYRLPTEAEWEYACRAGTTSKRFCGDDAAALDRYAWYTGNSEEQAHPVGEKEPNPWGLYDMVGNVYEWCWDWYADYGESPETDPVGLGHGFSRVLRGGSAWNGPWLLRSEARYWGGPAVGRVVVCFRCVRRSRRQP